MSEENNVPTTTAKATPPPSHGEMFFRYIAAMAQAAGIQAFTLAIAVPKEDGTSAVMAVAAGANGTSREWQVETAKLLGDQATAATKAIIAPEADKPEVV